jgi:hypothetical protein
LHLEDALDDVAPTQQHLPLRVGQVRTRGDELLHDRPPVPQPELEQEMIDHHRQPLLIGDNRTQAGRRHRLLECPVEPGLAGEFEQLPLQLDTAHNQGVHVGPARPRH